jgi:hypothetical protein
MKLSYNKYFSVKMYNNENCELPIKQRQDRYLVSTKIMTSDHELD